MFKVAMVILLFPMVAIAGDYQPLEEDFQSFRGYYLYPSLQAAIHSDSISEAIQNWSALAEEAQMGSDPALIDDITQYEIYRSALKELIRLNYFAGNRIEGDKRLRQLEDMTMVEKPSGLYLHSICETSCK